ncbi:PTS system mannose/fructose/sorbose family transporter subunit IID, partial [Klebsiella pneumoniae]|uniref:PTS system mannose/fructose/sorbose family transporter subunit IID n=1 Tax=Klebsiella TaxID=570 RepID=UPI00215C0D55
CRSSLHVPCRGENTRSKCPFKFDHNIPLSFGAGEAKTQVQDIINDILPCMLPLVSFGIVYWLLGRKVKPLSIIGGMALVGILGSWIGLF